MLVSGIVASCVRLCAAVLLLNLQTQRKALSSPVDAKTVSQREDNSSKVRETVNKIENKIYSCVPSPLNPVCSEAQRPSADPSYHFQAVLAVSKDGVM